MSGKSFLILFVAILTSISTLQRTASSQEPEAEFESLFNGKDLAGWEGDSRFWRVEGGAVVGQTTKDNPTKKNTFLVYSRDTVDDFELRFSYRVKGGNSGVQYRSELLSKWVVKGLQADFSNGFLAFTACGPIGIWVTLAECVRFRRRMTAATLLKALFCCRGCLRFVSTSMANPMKSESYGKSLLAFGMMLTGSGIKTASHGCIGIGRRTMASR